MEGIGSVKLSFASACFMLAGMVLSGMPMEREEIPGHCIVGLDGDLAGVGVRAALYVQGIVLSRVLLLGLVHTEDTGVKEIGASLMISQLAFSMSLALRMTLGTLNHLDAMIGLISLDAQLAAVSMLLSTKQVLAARWMVVMICICQLVGFVTLGIGMGRFRHVVEKVDGCDKFIIGWFGYIRPLREGPPIVYWCYFIWRIVTWIANQRVCFCFMNIFDQEERVGRESGEGGVITSTASTSDTGHGTTTSAGPEARMAQPPPYHQRSSTIFTLFSGPFVALWFSMDVLEKNIEVLGLTATNQWRTTGQSTAIVLAVGSVLRVLWLTWRSARKATFSTSHMRLDDTPTAMSSMRQPTMGVRPLDVFQCLLARKITLVVLIVTILIFPTKFIPIAVLLVVMLFFAGLSRELYTDIINFAKTLQRWA
ncbi:hypothetical protein K440DRAFT_657736 [Wilcoxina mikolae CBS 423.85]|nr:hypothetical protein K440DRAFT_657736 [Wilcoxina mikolae CBS 423.85]